MKIKEDCQMKRKIQGYDARIDESLGERRGAERVFHQSVKSRRDESKGEEHKKDAHHDYDAVHGMDGDDKKRLKHHMMAAHHKFMAHHHRRKMHKK